VPLDTKLRVSDLFDSLEREKEQEIRKIKVHKDKDLEALCKNYEKWLEFPDHLEYEFEKLYSRAKKLKQKPTSKEITNLSILLPKYQDHKYFDYSGIFISYLINESEEENFSIITTGLERLLNYIGLYNKKDIVINSDAGCGVGYKMQSGEIHVEGDVGDSVGWGMKNGKIYVKGNAGNWVGEGMQSGEIHVKGNVGSSVGLGMQSGEIHVDGNAGNLVGEGMKNGKIHVKGNAGDLVGLGMQSGEIHVNGNAGNLVGWGMQSGEIHVEGDIKELSNYIRGGNVYYKGKLIVENGRLIK